MRLAENLWHIHQKVNDQITVDQSTNNPQGHTPKPLQQIKTYGKGVDGTPFFGSTKMETTQTDSVSTIGVSEVSADSAKWTHRSPSESGS